MKISITEFRKHVGRYLKKSQEEIIYLTKYNKIIAQLSYQSINKNDIVEKLIGCISTSCTLEEAREERLSKI